MADFSYVGAEGQMVSVSTPVPAQQPAQQQPVDSASHLSILGDEGHNPHPGGRDEDVDALLSTWGPRAPRRLQEGTKMWLSVSKGIPGVEGLSAATRARLGDKIQSLISKHGKGA